MILKKKSTIYPIFLLLIFCAIALIVLPISCKKKNRAPEKPTLTGPSSTYDGKMEIYTAKAKDPDKNEVRFIFNWGEGYVDTSDYVASEEEYQTGYAFQSPGLKTIKVIAQDIKGATSPESDPLSVTVQVNYKPTVDSVITLTPPDSFMAGYPIRFSTTARDTTDSVYVKFMYKKKTATSYDTLIRQGPAPSPATFTTTITFNTPDTYIVRAIAIDTKGKESDTSKAVKLYTQGPSISTITASDEVIISGAYVYFSVMAYSSDSVQVRFMHRKKNITTWTSRSWRSYLPSGSTFEDTITFTTTSTDTYIIRAVAKDSRNNYSDTAPPVQLVVITQGAIRPTIDTIIGPGPSPFATFARSVSPYRYIPFTTRAFDAVTESVQVRFMYRKPNATTYTLRSWLPRKYTGSIFRDSINFPVPTTRPDTYIIRAIARNKLGALSDTTPPFIAIVVGWEFQIPDEYPFTSSPALGLDASNRWRIFIGAQDGFFYAIKPEDGTQAWREATVSAGYPNYEEVSINATPAVNQSLGKIYCGSEEGELYCVSTSGTTRWRYPDSSYDGLTFNEYGSSAAIGADGRIFVGCDDCFLYVLRDNGSSSDTIKRYYAKLEIASSPAIDAQGFVYFGDDSGYVTKLNSNGQLQWRRRIGISVQSSPTIVSDRVYVGTEDGYLYALSTSTGTPLWPSPYQAGDGIRSSPVVGTDNNIYFGCDDGKLYGVTPTGTAVSGFPVQLSDEDISSTPAIASNGTIIVYTNEDKVFGVSQSGNILWQVTLASAKKSSFRHTKQSKFDVFQPSPTIGPDGTIYVASSNGGGVFAIKGMVPGLSTTSPWPKFRHDIRNTGRANAPLP
ncbi:MAG: PQQ-binding-like beta-propeller repeat protein [candidate division WOR-3 bacterium]|nr:PQQ-binding-like beta-propeller repeat protein [candidate division WOR-3 bacterium]